jgi:hypothetical protein
MDAATTGTRLWNYTSTRVDLALSGCQAGHVNEDPPETPESQKRKRQKRIEFREGPFI